MQQLIYPANWLLYRGYRGFGGGTTKRLALYKNNEILYLENMSDTQNSSDKLDGII